MANGPNIFQMLIVIYIHTHINFISFGYTKKLCLILLFILVEPETDQYMQSES